MRTNKIVIKCLYIRHVLKTEIASEQMSATVLISPLITFLDTNHRSAGNKGVLTITCTSCSYGIYLFWISRIHSIVGITFQDFKAATSFILGRNILQAPCSQTPLIFVLPLTSETMFHTHTKQACKLY
jgi:hypothetical protein